MAKLIWPTSERSETSRTAPKVVFVHLQFLVTSRQANRYLAPPPFIFLRSVGWPRFYIGVYPEYECTVLYLALFHRKFETEKCFALLTFRSPFATLPFAHTTWITDLDDGSDDALPSFSTAFSFPPTTFWFAPSTAGGPLFHE